MVVMAMIAIMVSVTIVTLSGARDKKVVEGEARKLAAVVRELQNYALTGKQLGTGRVTCSVGMDAIEGGVDTGYDVFYTYRSGTDCGTSTSSVFATYALSGGVAFSNSINPFSFSVPRGEINLGGNPDPTPIRISKGSVTYTVCIYQSGRIEDVDGATCP